MANKKNILSFDDITEDGRLWAVRYEGDDDNILDVVFAQWDVHHHWWCYKAHKDNAGKRAYLTGASPSRTGT